MQDKGKRISMNSGGVPRALTCYSAPIVPVKAVEFKHFDLWGFLV